MGRTSQRRKQKRTQLRKHYTGGGGYLSRRLPDFLVSKKTLKERQERRELEKTRKADKEREDKQHALELEKYQKQLAHATKVRDLEAQIGQAQTENKTAEIINKSQISTINEGIFYLKDKEIKPFQEYDKKAYSMLRNYLEHSNYSFEEELKKYTITDPSDSWQPPTKIFINQRNFFYQPHDEEEEMYPIVDVFANTEPQKRTDAFPTPVSVNLEINNGRLRTLKPTRPLPAPPSPFTNIHTDDSPVP